MTTTRVKNILSVSFGASILWLGQFAIDLVWRAMKYREHLLSYLTPSWFFLNFIPTILLSLFALSVCAASRTLFSDNQRYKTLIMFIAVLLLVVLDQGVQVFVDHNKDTLTQTLVNGWLGLEPIPFGTKAEIGFAMGNLGKARVYAVIPLFVFMCIFIRYLLYFGTNAKCYLNAFIALFLAAGICSILGGLLPGILYSNAYDYVRIEHRLAFDIKDVYVCLGFGPLALWYMHNRKIPAIACNKPNLKYFKEYLAWERGNIKTLFRGAQA